jgi:hypothetical protein
VLSGWPIEVHLSKEFCDSCARSNDSTAILSDADKPCPQKRHATSPFNSQARLSR